MSLPMSWTVSPLSNLLDQIVGGGTPSKAVPANFMGKVPFMTVKDMKARFIADTIDHITEDAVESSATTKIPADTLIVAARMSLGKIVRPSVEVAINQDLKALFPSQGIDKTYIEYFWRFKSDLIQSKGTGTTVKGIRVEDIENLQTPLAPENEQCRIAKKLDNILSRVDALNDCLNRIAPLLKRFRQSILTTATSGGLTADWREINNFGLASSFFPIYGSLPSNWNVVKIHELKSIDKYSLAIGPFGSNLRKSDYSAQGVPLVFVREIRAKSFGKERTKYISLEKSLSLNAHTVSSGDILLTKMGDPPGDVAIYPKGLSDAVITADCIKLKVNSVIACNEYIAYALESSAFKSVFMTAVAGVAQQKVSLARFRDLPLALPPVQEQTEIVRRVEILFAYADRLEARLQTARTAADRLTPALLAKAFRGELVPQDPSDEPAAELLRRLREARGTEVSAKPKRGRKPVA